MQDVIFLSEEEMKLRDEDKKWFTGEIARQLAEVVDSFKPYGWRKLVHVLRELGPIIGTCSFVLGLIAIIITLAVFAGNKISQESEFRGKTGQRLDSIETRLSGIEKSILSIQVKQTAIGPISQKNVKDATQILESARKNHIQIPPSVVEESGKSFINASRTNPDAWDAAMRFAEYRSYLNSFVPSPLPAKAAITTTEYFLPTPKGLPKPELNVVGEVPADKAARFNVIGQGLRTNTGFGNEFILVSNGAIAVDDYELRNVVFQNVHIVYRGRPIQMTNVYFIGCTFEFIQDSNSIEVAGAILSGPSVTLWLS
jgi:hypothetical protein